MRRSDLYRPLLQGFVPQAENLSQVLETLEGYWAGRRDSESTFRDIESLWPECAPTVMHIAMAKINPVNRRVIAYWAVMDKNFFPSLYEIECFVDANIFHAEKAEKIFAHSTQIRTPHSFTPRDIDKPHWSRGWYFYSLFTLRTDVLQRTFALDIERKSERIQKVIESHSQALQVLATLEKR